MVERRKFKRPGVPESMFFVSDHDTCEMAMIKDIGMGGLKLEYVSVGNDELGWRKIDIFRSKGNRFHLIGIDCKRIYTIDELAENRTFSGSLSQSSGLKFIRLTGEQKTKLESLINQI